MEIKMQEINEDENTIELTPREKMLTRRMRLKKRVSDQQELNAIYAFRVKREFVYAILSILMLIYNTNSASSAGFAFWVCTSIFFSFAYNSSLKTQQRGKDMLNIFKKRLKDAEMALEEIEKGIHRKEPLEDRDEK